MKSSEIISYLRQPEHADLEGIRVENPTTLKVVKYVFIYYKNVCTRIKTKRSFMLSSSKRINKCIQWTAVNTGK